MSDIEFKQFQAMFTKAPTYSRTWLTNCGKFYLFKEEKWFLSSYASEYSDKLKGDKVFFTIACEEGFKTKEQFWSWAEPYLNSLGITVDYSKYKILNAFEFEFKVPYISIYNTAEGWSTSCLNFELHEKYTEEQKAAYKLVVEALANLDYPERIDTRFQMQKLLFSAFQAPELKKALTLFDV